MTEQPEITARSRRKRLHPATQHPPTSAIARTPVEEPTHPVIERNLKNAVAITKLGIPAVNERIAQVWAELYDKHNYSESPIRFPKVSGSGGRYVVLDSNGKALFASNDLQMTKFHCDTYPHHHFIDLNLLSAYERKTYTNVIGKSVGSTIFEEPAKQPLPNESEPKPEDHTELVSEMRKEVYALQLVPEQSAKVERAAIAVALTLGREAALDMIREIEFRLYTGVLDTGILRDDGKGFKPPQLIAEYPNYLDAHADVKLMNQTYDGMIRDAQGRPLRYRYKLTKPHIFRKENA